MPVTLALRFAPTASYELSIGATLSTLTYAVMPPAERRLTPVPGGFCQVKTYGPLSPETPTGCQKVATDTFVPLLVCRISVHPPGGTIVRALALISTVTCAISMS